MRTFWTSMAAGLLLLVLAAPAAAAAALQDEPRPADQERQRAEREKQRAQREKDRAVREKERAQPADRREEKAREREERQVEERRDQADQQRVERREQAEHQVVERRQQAEQAREQGAQARDQVARRREGLRQRESRPDDASRFGPPGRGGPDQPGQPPGAQRGQRVREFQALLEAIRNRRPELAKRLNEILEQDPNRFEELLLRSLAERLAEMPDAAPESGRARQRRPVPADQPPQPGRPEAPRERVSRRPGGGPEQPAQPPMLEPPGARGPRRPGADRPPEPPVTEPPGARGARRGAPDQAGPPARRMAPGEAGPQPRRAGPAGEGPDGPGGDVQRHRAEIEKHMGELREAHQEREQQARKIAERFRALRRERPDGAEPRELVEQLHRNVNEQFELRSELRKGELERIESELARLRETVERLRAELEQRAAQRDMIIQRRVRELMERGDGPK